MTEKFKLQMDIFDEARLVKIGIDLEGGPFYKSVAKSFQFAEWWELLRIKNSMSSDWDKYKKIGERNVKN